MYKLIIRPVLEYCSQTLSYGRYSKPSNLAEPYGFAKELEQIQTEILKNLIDCPRSTSPKIVRLFCGVEPLACRLEMLKLRYFWKIMKGPPDSIPHKVIKYRKDRFLGTNKNFAHEAFNICCKYNVLHLWHGNASRHKNPLREIKKAIISQNFRKDLENGRNNKCSFATVFLSNPTEYPKEYNLLGILRQTDCFETHSGRKRVVKALLHPCSYEETCPHCNNKYLDKFHHFLSFCHHISGYRKKLLLELTLYNFPTNRIPMKKEVFLGLILTHKSWRKCLTNFLTDADF